MLATILLTLPIVGLTNISPALITSKWMFYWLESKNIGFPGIMHTGSEALGRLTLLPEPHRVLCVLKPSMKV